MHRGTLEVGPYRYDTIESGPESGPLVLLLHGWPEFSEMWAPVMEALGADGRRAVAVDQRGYSPGARPQAASDYAAPALVADVFGFADALGAPQFDLVAHDWGGIVGWIAAGVGAARIRSLTMLATPHPAALAEALASDPDQQRRFAYAALHTAPDHQAEAVYLADGAATLRSVYGGIVSAAHVEDYVRRLSEPGVLTATLNWYRAPTAAGEVPPCAVPTLYAWGDQDVALGERAALATKDHVSGPYRFERLAGISHWVTDEAPETVIALARQQLAAYSPLPAAQ